MKKKKIGEGKTVDERALQDLTPKDATQVKGGPAGVNNFRVFVFSAPSTK